MRATKFYTMFLVIVFTVAWSHIAIAQQKSITLPKGTKVEKIGAGHFKFKLPDGQVVEVKGLNRTGSGKAILGDGGIYDRTGKLIASGKQGSLLSGPKPVEDAKHIKSSRDYVKIDDDVTWLPATITFQGIGIIDPQPPGRPLERSGAKALSPQPDPPGKK